VEILDTGGESERAIEPPPQRVGDLDVDLGHLGDLAAATDDDLLGEPGGTPSAARAALTTLTDGGTLGLAAVLIQLITLGGGSEILTSIGMGGRPTQTEHDILQNYATSIGMCATASLVLALAGLFRLRADAPAWARAAAGAGVIVGVLLLALTGYLLWGLSSSAATGVGTGA
jgi:hypothetical protein